MRAMSGPRSNRTTASDGGRDQRRNAMTLKGWHRRPRQPLPPDWEQRRATVLARDGHRCVDCGSTQRLEVVHIADLDDHASSNLQTLCPHCRGKQTARRHPAS